MYHFGKRGRNVESLTNRGCSSGGSCGGDKKLELLHSEPHGNKEIWEIISDELRKDNKAYYLL